MNRTKAAAYLFYWSSTVAAPGAAYFIPFKSGYYGISDMTETYNTLVRAVRSF